MSYDHMKPKKRLEEEWKYCAFCGGEMEWLPSKYFERNTGKINPKQYWVCKNGRGWTWGIHDKTEVHYYGSGDYSTIRLYSTL